MYMKNQFTYLKMLPPYVFIVYLLYGYAIALSIEPATSNYTHSELLTTLHKFLPAMQLVNVTDISKTTYNKIRILCWVNTYHKNHATRLHSIQKTWGKKCDKLLFMSDIEDTDIPTVRIRAPPVHEMLWQKHREVVRLLLREYDENDFDYIFKCDDDTFVIMENLRAYLGSSEIQALDVNEPLLFGHRMTLQWWEMQRPFRYEEQHMPEHYQLIMEVKKKLKPQGGLYYTPGGGGYAMNFAYLRQLEAAFDKPHCLPNEVVPDDWAISFCMYHENILPRDTRDELKRERFHQYDPHKLYFTPHDENAYDHKVFSSIYKENNFFSDHMGGIGWQNGTNCCAPDSISFHYIKPPYMELFYDYYYHFPR